MTPVEYEHVKAKPSPGKSVHHGSIERLFVRKHPGLLRQGEVEIVPVSEPEENVLQGGAPSLVGFRKGNLQIFLSYKIECYRHYRGLVPVSSVNTFRYSFVSLFHCPKRPT